VEGLAAQMSQAISNRLAAAERTIASGHPGPVLAGQVELRGAFDPARRPGNGPIRRPIIPGSGAETRLPVREPALRPWFIRKAINFHAYVGAFLDFVVDLIRRPRSPAPNYTSICSMNYAGYPCGWCKSTGPFSSMS
jgi:hypothetical protein